MSERLVPAAAAENSSSLCRPVHVVGVRLLLDSCRQRTLTAALAACLRTQAASELSMSPSVTQGVRGEA